MKPILFNTEMVQAILEGRKTTTRRIVKNIFGRVNFYKAVNELNGNKHLYAGFYNETDIFEYKGERHIDAIYSKAPYEVGDILYVRETWKVHSMKNYEKNIKILYKAEPNETLNEIHVSNERYEEYFKFMNREGWIPNIHMPKEAARLYLKVTDVRVERLHDIDFEGCKKEGVKAGYDGWLKEWSNLWDSTVNKKDINKYGWDADPFVWVIEFERCDKPNE